MRVLHVISGMSPRSGGPTAAVFGLVRALSLSGKLQSVKLWTTDDDYGGRLEESYKKHLASQIDVEFFRSISRSLLILSPQLALALHRHIQEYDLIHIHGLWQMPDIVAARIAQRKQVPYILTPHGMLSPYSVARRRIVKLILWRFLERTNVRRAKAVHLFSREEPLSDLMSEIDVPRIYVPNGISLIDFDIDRLRNKFRERYGIPLRSPIVLFMGRLHPIKGLDVLIDGFRHVAHRCPDARLVLVGPDCDGYRAQVEERIRSRHLEHQVVLTGMLTGEAKKNALMDADIFVLPSRQEGQSMALLEAMCFGLPVVITPACSFNVVQEVGAGVVVNGDEHALANALCQMIENPESREAMGKRGVALVHERYTWEAVAEQMVDQYRRIIGTII